MVGLNLFSPLSVATASFNAKFSSSPLPVALAAQAALNVKTSEVVIEEARTVMAMSDAFHQQRAVLEGMGFDEDESEEILSTVFDLQKQQIDLSEYPRLKDTVDEIFSRLAYYAKIAEYGKNVNADFLLGVSTCLQSETIQEVRDNLVAAQDYLSGSSSLLEEKTVTQEPSEYSEQKQASLSDGLIAYYPFTDGSTQDFSGNGHHGTIVGSVLASADINGRDNQAKFFDGDSYILGSSTGFPSADRTISLWFFYNGRLSHPTLFAYGGGECGTSYLMFIHTDPNPHVHYAIQHCKVGGIFQTITPIISEGNWHHWVFVSDSISTKMYIDLQLVANQDSRFGFTNTQGKHFSIGVGVSGAGFAPFTNSDVNYFTGSLDEIYVYDRALSYGEIRYLNGLGALSSSISRSGSTTLSQSFSGSPSATPIASSSSISGSSSTTLGQSFSDWPSATPIASSSSSQALITSPRQEKKTQSLLVPVLVSIGGTLAVISLCCLVYILGRRQGSKNSVDSNASDTASTRSSGIHLFANPLRFWHDREREMRLSRRETELASRSHVAGQPTTFNNA